MRIEVSVHQINQDPMRPRLDAFREKYGQDITLVAINEPGAEEAYEIFKETNADHAEVDDKRPGPVDKTLTSNIEISIPHNLLASMINAIHTDVHQRLETIILIAPLLGAQVNRLKDDEKKLTQALVEKFNRELDELNEVSSLISQLNKIRLAELPNSIDREGLSEKDMNDLEALLRGDVFPDN